MTDYAQNPMQMKFINLTHYYSGKVRELYALDDSFLAFVTTDRISAFDTVLGSVIPGKGEILNKLSFFWTKRFDKLVPTHLYPASEDVMAGILQQIGDYQWLKKRTMLVRKAEMIPVECIVRGYIAGSAWQEYVKHGTIPGYKLPSGLHLGDRLPEPLFTPSTKNKQGPDQNISVEEARSMMGSIIDEISRISLQLYHDASTYAEKKGIVIADTKFEFGIIDGQLSLADEVLTPDSSRFWSVSDSFTGIETTYLDKQLVRDWLVESGWNRKLPTPKLPRELCDQVYSRYLEVYNKLVKT